MLYISNFFFIKMGNVISSSIAASILPYVMSSTGSVIKGIGTIHGIVTPFVSRAAAKGLWFALLG
jgi:hypothetical protein